MCAVYFRKHRRTDFLLCTPVCIILPLAASMLLPKGIGIVQAFTLWELAVRTAKSVLVLLSAIGRISVLTRLFVQVQLGRSQVPRWPQATRQTQAARWAQCTHIDIHFFSGRQKTSSSITRFGWILIASRGLRLPERRKSLTAPHKRRPRVTLRPMNHLLYRSYVKSLL